MTDWILLAEGDETLLGLSDDEVAAAKRAGVVYECPVDDGTCPNGGHTGPGFLHLAHGKTFADFDALQD